MEKKISIQILEYLRDNDGDEDFVDLKAPFQSLLDTMEGRHKFKKGLTNLIKRRFIEVKPNSYLLITGRRNGKLEDLSSYVIKGIIRQPGLDHLKEQGSTKIKAEKNPSFYLIDTVFICKLYMTFKDKYFRDVNEIEFIESFDLANIPTKHPVYPNIKNFCAILSELTLENGAKETITDKIALSHFNIKNFRQIKCKLTGNQGHISRQTRAILNLKELKKDYRN